MRRIFWMLSLGASMLSVTAGCSHLTGMSAVSAEIINRGKDKNCHEVGKLLKNTSLFGGSQLGTSAGEDRIFSIERMLGGAGQNYNCDITDFTISAHAEGSFRPVYEAPITDPRERLRQEELQIRQMIERMMACYRDDCLSGGSIGGQTGSGNLDQERAPFRILVFAHGGLVSHDKSIERAQLMAPAMMADGFYPLFITWNSPFPQAYFQRLCCLSDGSPSTAITSVMVPFRLAGDLGAGVARIPENTIEQAGRFLSSRQASDRLDSNEVENGDIAQAREIDRDALLAEEQYRIWPVRSREPNSPLRCVPYLLRHDFAGPVVDPDAANEPLTLAQRRCPDVVFPPFRNRNDVEVRALNPAQLTDALYDLNGRKSELVARLGNVAMVPVRTVVSGVSGAGASAWDGMVRRARLGFSREFVVHYRNDTGPNSSSGGEKQVIDGASAIELAAVKREAIRQAQEKCLRALERLEPVGSVPPNNSRYFTNSTPGTHFRFFERLSHCINLGAFGSNVEVNVFGHSMGAIVANELIDKVRTLPYNNVVYMGGAATIRDTAASVDRLRRTSSPKSVSRPHFYNLMLHPISESIETSEGLSWQSLTPRGSLLEWIDEMFEGPRDVSERTVGKWRNIREGSQVFRHTSIVGDGISMRMRVFPVTFSNRDIGFSNFLQCWPYASLNSSGLQPQVTKCTPERHGEFSDYSFWREPFFTGTAPPVSSDVGAWRANQNFSSSQE